MQRRAPALAATAPAGPPVLDQVVGYQLARAAVVANAVYERCVGTPLSLRPVEYTILALVRQNPGGSSVMLAKVLRVSRPHVSLWVEKLESRGLLSREPNASDRRSQHLRVTPKGDALAGKATRRLVGGERHAFVTLTMAERLMLTELLQKLADAPADPARDGD